MRSYKELLWSPDYSLAEKLKLYFASGIIAETNSKPDYHCMNLLHVAVKIGDLPFLKKVIIIEKTHDPESFDINIRDDNGWTPLHVAAASKLNNIAKFLLKIEHADIKAKTKTGDTLIGLAAELLNYDLCKSLLKKGELMPKYSPRLWPLPPSDIDKLEFCHKRLQKYLTKKSIYSSDRTQYAELTSELKAKIANDWENYVKFCTNSNAQWHQLGYPIDRNNFETIESLGGACDEEFII